MVVANLTYLVAIIGGHDCNSLVTTNCQLYDKTKFHMVKGIDNAFDHVELCFVLNRRNISMKIGLFFQDITFITEFPGSKFLLPTFLTGGIWDFQVANLLLATVHFEPYILPVAVAILIGL